VFNACARHHGLREVFSYQPASRYWPFQWEETAIFLALALVLVGISVWWLVIRDEHVARRVRRVRTESSSGARDAERRGRELPESAPSDRGPLAV